MGKKKIQKTLKGKKENNQDVVQGSEVDQPSQCLSFKISEREENSVLEPCTKNKSQASADKKPQLNFISEEFYSRVDKFKAFHEELLRLKGLSGSDQLKDIVKTTGAKLEAACAQVLKSDLEEAEKWITGQQNCIQDQIQSTRKAEENIKEVLQNAGTFTEEEIANQTLVIEQKRERLQKCYEDFTALRERSQKIYTNEPSIEEVPLILP